MIPYAFGAHARAGAVMAVAALASACSSSPSQPTPVDPGGPKISCPAAPQPVQAPDASGATVVFGAPSVTGGATPLTGPSCTAASGSKFTVGTTTVTCTVSDAKSRSDACSFAIVVSPPAVVPKLSVTRFVAFGDSITWGEDGTNFSLSPADAGRLRPAIQFPTADTYPGALETNLRQRYSTQTPTVRNAGQSNELVTGSTTFTRFVSYTSSGQYDVVLIMEGANDLGDRDSRVFPAIIAALQRMIQDAKGRRMRPMLATLTPENQMGIRGLAWSLVPMINDQIRALAASEGVPLVDVYQAFGGDVTTLIGFDGLHPTALGYHRIADTFLASVKATLETSPTPSTNRPSIPFFTLPRRR